MPKILFSHIKFLIPLGIFSEALPICPLMTKPRVITLHDNFRFIYAMIGVIGIVILAYIKAEEQEKMKKEKISRFVYELKFEGERDRLLLSKKEQYLGMLKKSTDKKELQALYEAYENEVSRPLTSEEIIRRNELGSMVMKAPLLTGTYNPYFEKDKLTNAVAEHQVETVKWQNNVIMGMGAVKPNLYSIQNFVEKHEDLKEDWNLSLQAIHNQLQAKYIVE